MTSDCDNDVLGVIAGAGKFPDMVIEGARQAGLRVVVLGLKEIADPSLAELADEFHWVAPLRLGEWIRTFKPAGVTHAVMAGYVRKQTMFRRFGILSFLPDRLFLKLWFLDIPDKRNDTVLKAVAELLAQNGIVLEDVTRYCPSAVAPEGVLGAATLSAAMRRHLDFGWLSDVYSGTVGRAALQAAEGEPYDSTGIAARPPEPGEAGASATESPSGVAS